MVKQATKPAENIADVAVGALEAAIGPMIKPIIQVAESLNRVHGKFQQTLFGIVRKAKSSAEAVPYFKYVEFKVCEHFAEKNEDGTLKGALPTIAEIPGLGSWTAVKSSLMKGYDIPAKLGMITKSVGSLDPTEERFAGKDGASVWLKEIKAVQVQAQADYAEELKKLADQKSAAATGSLASDTGSGSVIPPTAAVSQGDGNDARTLFELPEMIQAGMSVLTRVVQEASKVKTENKDFYRIVGQTLRTCADQIGQLIAKQQDSARDALLASNRPQISRENASEMLALRRTLSEVQTEAA